MKQPRFNADIRLIKVTCIPLNLEGTHLLKVCSYCFISFLLNSWNSVNTLTNLYCGLISRPSSSFSLIACRLIRIPLSSSVAAILRALKVSYEHYDVLSLQRPCGDWQLASSNHESVVGTRQVDADCDCVIQRLLNAPRNPYNRGSTRLTYAHSCQQHRQIIETD